MEYATDPETFKNPGNFAILDAKLAEGFGKVLNAESGRKLNVFEEIPALCQEMLSGGEITWHVYQNVETTECEGVILELKDILRVEMEREDGLRASLNDWELVLSSLMELSAKDIQKSLYRRQLDKEESLRQMLAQYDLGISNKGESIDYDRLISMCQMHVETRRREKVANDLCGRLTHPGKQGVGLPAVLVTLVASTLASTGESLMIGGSEASQVENCHWDAGGCNNPALPPILSYLPKSLPAKHVLVSTSTKMC